MFIYWKRRKEQTKLLSKCKAYRKRRSWVPPRISQNPQSISRFFPTINTIQYIEEPFFKQQNSETGLPSKQPCHLTRHDTWQAKPTENSIPKRTSNLTVKKKMIDRLPISFAQAASINHNKIPFSKVINSEDLP